MHLHIWSLGSEGGTVKAGGTPPSSLPNPVVVPCCTSRFPFAGAPWHSQRSAAGSIERRPHAKHHPLISDPPRCGDRRPRPPRGRPLRPLARRMGRVRPASRALERAVHAAREAIAAELAYAAEVDR